jgi:hypothetical protein
MGAAALAALLVPALPAQAVEYRLQVTSIFSSAYVSFLKARELKDGASGPGLDRLESSVDRGDLPRGAILFDRRVQPVRESLGRAYGGARVVPRVTLGGEGSTIWDEISWEGTPGERSVWIVSPQILVEQELFNAALRGTGPMRNFQPYGLPRSGSRVTVVSFPLNFLWFHEERGGMWDRYLARGLDLTGGIGAVVGVNTNAMFPDQVYIIVQHAEAPTTYKAVLVWRRRQNDRQAPGGQSPIIID